MRKINVKNDWRLVLFIAIMLGLFSPSVMAQGNDYVSFLASILEEKIKGEQKNDIDWMIMVIAVSPFGKDETLFGVIKSQKNIKLISLSSTSGSIYNQRETLIKEKAEVLTSEILLTTRVVDNVRCRELNRIAKEWETIKFPLVPENVLMLDATGYTVKAQSLYGETRILNFEGGEPGVDLSSPILKLIGDTMSKCSNKLRVLER